MRSLKQNELRVLRAILSSHEPTRANIARETRLSVVRVSSILKSLRTNRFVVNGGKTRSASGRPSIIYHIRPETGHSLGISIKREAIRVLAINPQKQVAHERTHALALSPEPAAHSEEIVNRLLQVLEQTLDELPQPSIPAISVGIALPGMVDTRRNIWLQGLRLSGISHVDLVGPLQSKIGIPTYIEDEARAIAYREKFLGFGQGTRDFVLLYLDEGIGTGIFNNNRMYRGHHGLSGEIGHITHPNSRYRCSCNNLGCMETILSTEGVLGIFKERLREGVRSVLQEHQSAEDLSLDDILEAADAGDRVARTTLFEIAQFLGDALVILVKLFNPQRIVISGRIAMFKSYLLEPAQAIITQQVHAEMIHDLTIHFADYQASHEAHGAAILGLLHYFGSRIKKADNP